MVCGEITACVCGVGFVCTGGARRAGLKGFVDGGVVTVVDAAVAFVMLT